ncbi:restriction endonuclease subunit S [Streptomyces melanosporofaciens]
MRETPEGWGARKLADVAVVGAGRAAPDGDGPYPLMGANGPIGRTSRTNFSPPGYIIGRVGAAGAVTKVRKPCWASDNALTVSPRGGVCDGDFIEHLLRHARLESLATQLAQPLVTKSALEAVYSIIPLDMREQKKIAAAISAAMQTEHAIEASISKFRATRKAILQSFMQPITDSTPPRGWQRLPLKAVAPSVEYGISTALNGDADGVPTLRMNNLRNGRVDLSELRYCPTPVRRQLLLRRGDVLFNRTNSIDHVGRAGIWLDDLPQATFASYLVRLNPDTKRLTPEYLVEWLQHPLIRQRVRAISTVAVQQVNVNPTRLRELEIDFPAALSEQRRLISMLATCDERISSEESELAKQRALKQGMTEDLLTGDVRFRKVA